MIRTILFDFGNVLGFFDHSRALKQLARFTNMDPTELALVLYGGVLEDDYEIGRISTSEYVEAACKNGWLRCSPVEFQAAFVDIFTENTGVTALIPLLKKNYRIVLASNTNDAHFRHYCKQFDHVLKQFDFLGASHQALARKPHREFYEYCQRFVNCEPSECLFVDDLPSNIAAAEAFGWQGIVLTSAEDLITRMKALGIRI